MIDVFVDVLSKLASDGIYNKAIDPAIAFSTFYAILTDQQLVGQILSIYFHRDPQHPSKTAILCLCEELFGEKIASALVKSWPIASSKVADLAERLHARICVSHTSTLNTNLQQGVPMQCASESPILGYLRRQIDELIQSCSVSKDSSQQIAPQLLLPILKNISNAAIKASAEWHGLFAEMQHIAHDRDAIVTTTAEKDEQIKSLRQRISDLEAGMSDMCAKVEVYMHQMETYSQEMAEKNKQILALHQQLKDTSRESADHELSALKELLSEKDSLISNVRADLAESTATADRLAQECVHLNQRSEELSLYRALVINTIDVLRTLSEKDAELSYSPPADDTYLKLPEYVAFIVDVIRTKARWLDTDESGRYLPLPSQETSPLLQSERVQSTLPSSVREELVFAPTSSNFTSTATNSSPTSNSSHSNLNHSLSYNYHSLGTSNISILGRLGMVGRNKTSTTSHPKQAQQYE